MELYHHGVKGMKWGIRRNRKSSGSSKSEGRKKQAPKESSSVKSKIDKGAKQASQFLKDNKKTLITSAVLMALTPAGAHYAEEALYGLEGITFTSDGLRFMYKRDLFDTVDSERPKYLML